MSENKDLKSSGFCSAAENPEDWRSTPRPTAKTPREIELEDRLRGLLKLADNLMSGLEKAPDLIPKMTPAMAEMSTTLKMQVSELRKSFDSYKSTCLAALNL